MSVQPSTQTLLLYCPYDRRVTRHVRRGSNQALVCGECGRRVDAADPEDGDADQLALQQTAAISQVPARRRARVRALRPTRSRASWLPYALVLLIVGAGIAIAVNLAVSLFGSERSGIAPTIAAPFPALQSGARTGEQGTAAPEAAAPTAPGAASSATLRVANTDGTGAFLRRTPSLNDRLRAWPDNTLLKVVGPDTTAEGVQWKNVEDPAGNKGWIPSQYTRAEPGT